MRTERGARPAAEAPTTKRWLVSMLRCHDGSLYTGATNDLPRGLAAHAAGQGARYTRGRLPVALAYVEPQPNRSQALRREAFLKKLPRGDKLRLTAPACRCHDP